MSVTCDSHDASFSSSIQYMPWLHALSYFTTLNIALHLQEYSSRLNFDLTDFLLVKNRQHVLVILQFMILTNCISMPDVSLGIDGERLPRLVILADTWVHMRDPSDSIKNTLIALHIIKQFDFLRKTLYDN